MLGRAAHLQPRLDNFSHFHLPQHRQECLCHIYSCGAATSRASPPRCAWRYDVIRIRISSPVAGACSCGISPFVRNDSAFFTAIQTEIASTSGGSLTALLE